MVREGKGDGARGEAGLSQRVCRGWGDGGRSPTASQEGSGKTDTVSKLTEIYGGWGGQGGEGVTALCGRSAMWHMPEGLGGPEG